MKVQILDIYDRGGSSPTVSFSSEIGSAVGSWRGERLPEVSRVYDVEIEIGDNLVWGHNICPVPGGRSEIKLAGDKVIITGLLEALHENGVATMRIADSVVLVDSSGEAPHTPCWVRVEVADLSLYDTNI
jgi:hypothetical protein